MTYPPSEGGGGEGKRRAPPEDLPTLWYPTKEDLLRFTSLRDTTVPDLFLRRQSRHVARQVRTGRSTSPRPLRRKTGEIEVDRRSRLLRRAARGPFGQSALGVDEPSR